MRTSPGSDSSLIGSTNENGSKVSKTLTLEKYGLFDKCYLSIRRNLFPLLFPLQRLKHRHLQLNTDTFKILVNVKLQVNVSTIAIGELFVHVCIGSPIDSEV